MKFPSLHIRRPLLREFLIFLVFTAVTAIMTWPWVLHLRDAVPDLGDPYAHSYFLWWNYHQTLHDPLNLFHATFLYPYRYTLAFGEFDYGISLVFFPLFALGVRPLTIYSLAAFLSFPFLGYGTFRLARTLSGSNAVSWVAGISIAFLPYRFHHLSHLPLIFAGWIPLVFEALVLFARKRSWARAGWLGFAFLMNALTCTTWLFLTAIPLGLSGILLLTRNQAWRDRNLWLRAGVTLGTALLILVPFMLPLRRVASMHGFVRSAEEVIHYSARPIHWLAADERSKVWRGFGGVRGGTEMYLFPGLVAPLLAIAAFFLGSRKAQARRDDPPEEPSKWLWLRLLDAVAVISAVFAILSMGYNVFKVRMFGRTLLTATDPDHALFILSMALIARCWIVYPRVLRVSMSGDKNLPQTISSPTRSELLGHGLIWIAVGFAGSFGLNFFFHRVLYEFIPVFKAMRVATRWAMICYIGLALLAGLGARRLAGAMADRWPRFGGTLTYAGIVLALLFELHTTPLKMMRGEVKPDSLTLYLQQQKMAGGILELPIGDNDHLYMLRAADHQKPLVNGMNSFVPPLQREIRQLLSVEPVPDQLLDMFEQIPVSYVTVHNSLLSAESRAEIDSFLKRGTTSGRLKFIGSFTNGGRQNNDLYAVTKTEPGAITR